MNPSPLLGWRLRPVAVTGRAAEGAILQKVVGGCFTISCGVQSRFRFGGREKEREALSNNADSPFSLLFPAERLQCAREGGGLTEKLAGHCPLLAHFNVPNIVFVLLLDVFHLYSF